jgi:RHS repeat-associated protein
MTGLRTIVQRYYASTYGRFNTADQYMASGGPGDPGSWNRYSYVGGDPVNFIDPFGEIKCSDSTADSCVDVVASTDPVPPGMVPGRGKNLSPGYDPADPFKSPLSVSQAWILADQFRKAVDPKKGFTECQALVGFANAVGQSATAYQFVRDLGVLAPNTTAAKAGLSYWNTAAVSLYNHAGDNGFIPGFQNTLPDSTAGNGDQVHHFAAFFEYGFANGAFAGGVMALAFEQVEGWNSSVNDGDVSLGILASQWGADLKAGKLSPSDIGSKIQGLCK